MKTFEFGELAELRKEKYNPLSNKSVPCIELEHVNQNSGTINGYVDSSEQKSIKNIFHKGDILFAKLRPYLRKYWFAEFNGVCSSEIWVLKPKRVVTAEYLFHLIQTEEFIRIANVSFGSKMPRADWDFINHYPLTIIHSLPEQRRIVSVLSLWDTAIAKQTQLVEKLTLRKRGLMQQLLTGKKRLKGFERGTFKMLSFDKIANTVNVKAFQVSKSDYQEMGKTPIVDQGQMFIAAYSNSDKIFTDIPFILFGDHTRIIKWIDFPCVIGADGVQAIKPKEEMDIKYLYYLLSNTELPNLGYSRHMSILKEKVFYVSTDINEQKAIAGCLSNADKEIEIQKQKLAAMQEQKKGLMQVLLTGKKRINE